VLRTLLQSGCTAEELVRIRAQWIVLFDRGAQIVIDTPRNPGRSRVVEISLALGDRLVSFSPCGQTFDLTPGAVRRIVRYYGDCIGIGRLTVSTTRSTWASHQFFARRRPIDEIAESLNISPAAAARLLVRDSAA
jgi:integrase